MGAGKYARSDLQRNDAKETFGTSGPMIKVRFFGSFNYAKDDVKKADFVKTAYAKGVPMGGDLKPGTGKAPTFLVMALKDPKSGNLDRVQIVKVLAGFDRQTARKNLQRRMVRRTQTRH